MQGQEPSEAKRQTDSFLLGVEFSGLLCNTGQIVFAHPTCCKYTIYSYLLSKINCCNHSATKVLKVVIILKIRDTNNKCTFSYTEAETVMHLI